MLSISEFAKACNTTVKTIRFYDIKGLLRADYVSAESGYRYYKRIKVADYSRIVALKEAGFSLDEIYMQLQNQNESEILEMLDKQLSLLKWRQEVCQKIKEEFIKSMENKSKWSVVPRGDKIIVSAQGQHIEINVKSDICKECAESIYNGLNEEQLITFDMETLDAFTKDKAIYYRHTLYVPVVNNTTLGELEFPRELKKASSLLYYASFSPDVDTFFALENTLHAIEKQFENVLVSANGESSEPGLELVLIGIS